MNKGILYLARKMTRETPGIAGEMYVRDGKKKVHICRTVERPWLDNKRGVSCIPPGEYALQRRTTGRYYSIYSRRWAMDFVCEVADVEGRDGILVHAGRNISDSRGCVLTAERVVIKNGKLSTAGTSRKAYQTFYKAVVANDIRRIIVFEVREAR